MGPLYSSSEQALRNAFRLFDTDGNGSIDRAELGECGTSAHRCCNVAVPGAMLHRCCDVAVPGAMLSKLGLLGKDNSEATVAKMFAAAVTS